MNKRPALFGVLILVFALVLAACGGGESPTPTPRAATPTPVPGPGPDPAATPTPEPVAADWRPSRPITFLVGFAPGGGHDLTARVLAPALREELGVPIVVQNAPGAQEYIMRSRLASARPDGHTFAITHITNGITDDVLQLQEIPYGSIEEFTHIGRLTFSPVTLIAGRHLGVNTFEELRNVPTMISDLSSSGNVLRDIVFGSALGYPRDGWDFRTLSSTGAPDSIQQTARGERDVYNMDTPVGNPVILAERNPIPMLHFDHQRHPLANEDSIFDVPSVAELGHPELVAFGLHRGLIAPQGLPADVEATLAEVFGRVLAREDIQQQLIAIGLEPAWSPGEEWAQTRQDMLENSMQFREQVMEALGR